MNEKIKEKAGLVTLIIGITAVVTGCWLIIAKIIPKIVETMGNNPLPFELILVFVGLFLFMVGLDWLLGG